MDRLLLKNKLSATSIELLSKLNSLTCDDAVVTACIQPSLAVRCCLGELVMRLLSYTQ
jgi:hypothetical protein